jgi:hypothetical protein
MGGRLRTGAPKEQVKSKSRMGRFSESASGSSHGDESDGDRLLHRCAPQEPPSDLLRQCSAQLSELPDLQQDVPSARAEGRGVILAPAFASGQDNSQNITTGTLTDIDPMLLLPPAYTRQIGREITDRGGSVNEPSRHYVSRAADARSIIRRRSDQRGGNNRGPRSRPSGACSG